MKNIIQKRIVCTLVMITGVFFSSLTSAHFMVAQHGTLNFVGDGVFMVLSLPMSAFELSDDDANGAISMVEFNRQRAKVVASIREEVSLRDESGPRLLLGLMLSPELDHDSIQENISQVIVMGKFNLDDLLGEMSFKVGLFGTAPEEQKIEVVAMRKSDNITQQIELFPGKVSSSLMSALLRSSGDAHNSQIQ